MAKKSISAIDSLNLELPDEGMVFILGPSGAGKTTLVSLLSGLLKPTSGKVFLNDKEIKDCSQKIAVLFQEHNLIEDMTTEENLSLVCKQKEKITEILAKLGMKDKATQKVNKLSGGEKKRISIARSLVEEVSILVLDEPTANLDSRNAEEVFSLLKEVSKTKLVINVSHDTKAADKYGDYLYEIRNGKVKLLKARTRFDDEIKKETDTAEAKKNKIGLSFFLSFSHKTIWKQPGKTIGSLALSCLSFALAMLLSSLSFFQLDKSLSTVFVESGANFIPLTSLHPKELASETIKQVEKTFPSFVPSVSISENGSNAELHVFPYGNGIKINGKSIAEPKKGNCVSTSLISEITSNSISFDWGETKGKTLKLSEIIPSGDLTEILEWYAICKDERGKIDSSSEFYRFSQQPSYLQKLWIRHIEQRRFQ